MVKSKVLISEITEKFREMLESYMKLENIAILSCNDKLIDILKQSIIEVLRKYRNDNYD